MLVGTLNAVVRLQPLDRCHQIRADALQLPEVRPELSTASVDREVSIASKGRRELATVENRKLISELVQSRRGIVETVTDDRSPLGSRVPHTIHPVDVHAAVTLNLTTEAVRVTPEDIEFRVEGVEVMSSPLTLEADAV
jgi:hypothetical protein